MQRTHDILYDDANTTKANLQMRKTALQFQHPFIYGMISFSQDIKIHRKIKGKKEIFAEIYKTIG